jgi:hypothetical protein
MAWEDMVCDWAVTKGSGGLRPGLRPEPGRDLITPNQSHELARHDPTPTATRHKSEPAFRFGSSGAFPVGPTVETHHPEIGLTQIAYIYVHEARCLGSAAKLIPPKLNRIIQVSVPHDPFLGVKVVGIIERFRWQTSVRLCVS